MRNAKVSSLNKKSMALTDRNYGEIPSILTHAEIKKEVGGGQTGIRTLETVSRLHTFQACAFDHSATCPRGGYLAARQGCCKGWIAVGLLFGFDSAQPNIFGKILVAVGILDRTVRVADRHIPAF